MIKFPPYLQKGDTIGITCPSGWMGRDKIDTALETLTKKWGFKVIVEEETIGYDWPNYLAAPDEVRLQGFQNLLDNKNVKAILCGRGGYGASKIIDELNWSNFKKNPKWIIGFSDITIFHLHVHKNFKIASIHSSMAAAFNNNGFENDYIKSIRTALIGNKKLKYSANAHQINKQGTASGELVGGNLTLLAHSIGTHSDIDTKNKILVIEEIGEYLYSADRLLTQLYRAGKLSKLAGLVIGGFTDMKDSDRPFGKTTYEIINNIVAQYDYPVCYDFLVSHNTENYALKMGATYELKVTKNKATLSEL